jgi:hypothetical protein
VIDQDPIARIDARLERMETKLDEALSLKATIEYVKYAIAGAYIGLLTLFGLSK